MPSLSPPKVMNRAKRYYRIITRPRNENMGNTITVTTADGHTLDAYVAGPENATQGVVVLQEIFGVNNHIKEMVDAFAAAGYKAIAPALFDRAEKGVDLEYGPDDRKKGFGLRQAIKDDQSLADIVGAAKALGTTSTAVVGYCWGGSLAWLSATRTKEFDAASCWYGGGIAATKDETPNCPVDMHFGETDASIPMTDVDAIKAAHPEIEVYVYPNAGHGFGCSDRDSWNPEAYELAQTRTLAFFKKNLK
jgi:carboxymethylenebutenolidase